MNINPGAAASIAGTSRAAARGGEADNEATQSTRSQSSTDKPAGKAADASSVDAGNETGDRDGNGRQMLDVFERADEEQDDGREEVEQQPDSVSPDSAGSNIDFEA